ncbi:MAG: 4-(cytidine 5'-diphospho)-2-C-methyl-D-erythritol kinase, partial [Pseudomonadota bacterium]
HGPISFSVSGPFGAGLDTGPGNLVSAAAIMLRQAAISRGFTPAPVSIHLEKCLPVSSGIGGGSADAAATLLSLSEIWNLDLDLSGLAQSLGADVLMCLQSSPLRMQGTGEKLQQLDACPVFHMVLVNPGRGVSTPDVFKGLAAKENPPMDPDPGNELLSAALIAQYRNDLEPVTTSLVPEILECKALLDEAGSLISRMSGSGATCFGLFPDAASATKAQSLIAAKKPDWWCIATQSAQT